MSKRFFYLLLVVILLFTFLIPSAFAQTSDKKSSSEPNSERRNEYTDAMPKDNVKQKRDTLIDREISPLEKVYDADKFLESIRESNKLFDDGPVTLKPLVILMDYPDYRYTEFLIKEDRPLYVSDSYEAWHYADMLFSDDTYKGPDNEDFISLNRFYLNESRGLLSVKGDVFGWYTAALNAAYYGSNEGDGSDQDNASILVVEAIEAVAREQNIDLTAYDIVDLYDVDKDGCILEPDGMIDSIILIHAGRGEEWWGGGYLGADAIWPFRGKISYYNESQSPHEVVDTFGNRIKADDFVVVEQDTPLGLVVHEYGHALELPDLYGYDEPVQNWSTMAGSYTGKVIGSMPISFGAYCKEQLQEYWGGQWQRQRVLDLNAIDERGVDVTLGATTSRNAKTDAIRINLPLKETVMATPYSGERMYFSGKGDNLRNSMIKGFDFTNLGGMNVMIGFEFKTVYDIETHWDYASIQIREEGADLWVPVAGNITTTENPHDTTPDDPTDRNPGHGITGSTYGEWIDAQFDLSTYAGKKIDLKFYYWTDSNTVMSGMYIDDIAIKVNGIETFFDDAEGESQFVLNGFGLDTGLVIAEHYYLLEWRNHQGVDEGLKHTHYQSAQTPYDPGLLVWYVDRTWGTIDRLDQDSYSHPGRVSVGIVDADQNAVKYYADAGYVVVDWGDRQMHDAAFSLRKGDEYFITWPGFGSTIDKNISINPVFDDSRDYTNPEYPELGLIVPRYGLKIFVTRENKERSTGKLHIMKGKGAHGSRDEDESDIEIESISVFGDKIVVETDEDDLGDYAFIGFISANNGQLEEKGIDLKFVDEDTYVGTIDDPDILNTDVWKINFIVIENRKGGRNAVYNSDVYTGFGVPLYIGLDDD